MAKVKDLFRQSNRLVDDIIDNIDMVDWFNGCNQTLSDIVYLPTLATITKTGGKFLVPANCNGELKILDPSTIEMFSMYDGEIVFDGADDVSSIQVTYNRFLNDITNDPDSEPELHKNFHGIYPAYAALIYMTIEDEPDMQKRYEIEVRKYRAQIQKYYGKNRPKPPNWKVVR